MTIHKHSKIQLIDCYQPRQIKRRPRWGGGGGGAGGGGARGRAPPPPRARARRAIAAGAAQRQGTPPALAARLDAW
ncbi:MAG: hypothetical protein K0M46_07920, partial [Thiobacillus sp.]|nr:hypothetical protein [Thiobacillus sp.]